MKRLIGLLFAVWFLHYDASGAFAQNFPIAAPKVTAYRNLDLGVTGQVVCATPCTLSGYYFSNNAATARFLKFYNKATAATQADTPILTVQIPPGAAANAFYGLQGWQFTTGLSVRATTGVADNDTGAPSANDVVVNLGTSRYITTP